MRRVLPAVLVTVLAVASPSADRAQSPARQAAVPAPVASHPPAPLSADAQQALVGRYCATCHSDRGKAGGLTLASSTPRSLVENGEVDREDDPQAARRHDAAAGARRDPTPAAHRRDGRGARNRDGYRRRRRSPTRLASVPAPEPRRVRRRRARPRSASTSTSAPYLPRRHDQRRLRQRRRRAELLAAADAGLSARRQPDQPAGGRRSQRQRHLGDLQDRAQPLADGAGGRARRWAPAAGIVGGPRVPGRRRLRDQDGDGLCGAGRPVRPHAAPGDGLQGAGRRVGRRRARGGARRQPDDDRDRLRPEQGPERHGAADRRRFTSSAGPHRISAAFIQRLDGPVDDLLAPDREHRRGRRRLRHRRRCRTCAT